MPARSPLPEREQAICQRLRAAREVFGVPRTIFAQRIGIDSSRLANYEHARTPVPYYIGERATKEMDICQRWLATEKLPKHPWFKVPDSFDQGVSKRLLFSFVYDKALADEIDSVMASYAELFSVQEEKLRPALRVLGSALLMRPAAVREATEKSVFGNLARLARSLPDAARTKLIADVRKLSAAYMNKHHSEMDLANYGIGEPPDELDARIVAERLSKLHTKEAALPRRP